MLPYIQALLPYLPQIIETVIALIEKIIEAKKAIGESTAAEQAQLDWLKVYRISTDDIREKMTLAIKID